MFPLSELKFAIYIKQSVSKKKKTAFVAIFFNKNTSHLKTQ